MANFRSATITRFVLRLAGMFGLLLITSLASASMPMVFQHLDVDEGLSQNTVMASYQDSRGFVWIATEGGLNRYDGYDVTVYGRDPGNPNALSNDYVWAIDEDSNGDIWLATNGGGVAVWSRASDNFTSYRHDPQDENSLSSNFIRNLLVDSAGNVWAATRNAGLNKLNPTTGDVTRYQNDSGNDSSIGSNTLFALLEDRDGNIWVGSDVGLSQFPIHSVDAITFDVGDSLRGKNILALAEDSAGGIWIGSFEGGLAKLNPVTGRVVNYQHNPDDPHSLSSNDVRAITEDKDSRLWIGTSNGLNLLDRRSGTFSHYNADNGNPYSLSDNFVMSLAHDDAGLMWVGTRTGGVSRWNPHSWSFGHRYPEWLEGASVTALSDDKLGNIWVGSIGAGLSRIDRTTGVPENISKLITNDTVLADERVMSLLSDSSGNLWIGTLNGGLSQLNAAGELSTFQHIENDPTSISANGVMSLYEDRVGRIWVGTFGGGINLFDTELQQFRRYSQTEDASDPLSGARATAITGDAQGNLWVGTDSAGLVLLDPDRGVIRQFTHDPLDGDSLTSDTIYSLHIDDENVLWLGMAGGGLNKMIGTSRDSASNSFAHFGRNFGINDVVYGIQTDDAGKLWLSTNRGLTQFDPNSQTVRTFHKSHGLQDEEFNFGAHHRASDGRLLFGGARGYNEFIPHALELSEQAPRVVLTSLEVHNIPVSTSGAVAEVNDVVLAHNDDVVSFGFSALDYVDPARNKYAYRLVGFDSEFIESHDLRYVTYTNLEPGDYVFQVKAASADNVWSDVALNIPVTVQAAPWQTSWAYALYVLAIIATIFGVFRQQNRRLLREEDSARRLSLEVAARTEELNKRNIELKEASQAKSNFLARMSHEIRTPMNGVIGMTELLRGTDLTARQSEFTHTISQSAESLLQIINDILDLSKIESGQFELDENKFHIGEVVEDVTVLLGSVAAKMDLELLGYVDPSIATMLIGDAARLRQILVNLVGNAIKFTDAGEVTVYASAKSIADDRAVLRIEVSDTGIGIEENKLQRVFEAFSQVDESTTQRFGGTGLGLSICQHLVSMMGGDIGVDSRLNIGSTFWCEIPFGVASDSSIRHREDIRGKKVMVLTPLRSQRKAITQYLAANGVAVVEVGSTSELGSIIARGECTFDALVVDADAIDLNRSGPILSHLNNAGVLSIFLARDPAVLESEPQGLSQNGVVIRKPLRWASLANALSDRAGSGPVAVTGSENKVARQARILVVEDNEVNQLVAEGMLKELGCEVSLASNGRRGLAKATTENYDIILMDAQMPDMDGYEATRLIRDWENGNQRVPIIGLSASASDDIGDDCKCAGMDDFMSKPYFLEVLANMVQKWVPDVTQSFAVSSEQDAASDFSNDVRLDRSALDNIRQMQSDDRPDILRRVLNAFLTGSAQLLSDVNRGRSQRCLATLRSSAHALKSSSSSIGALEFSKIASRLENACRAENAEEALDLSACLVAMYGQVTNAVHQELERTPS